MKTENDKKEVIKKHKLDQLYIDLASRIAEMSVAERNKVGCIIVKDTNIIAYGWNGMPKGFDNKCEDDNNVTKKEVLHAESNAISKIAKYGQSSNEAILYITLSPCIECAKLIIQTGIKRVVYSTQYRKIDGIKLLLEANIEVNQLKS